MQVKSTVELRHRGASRQAVRALGPWLRPHRGVLVLVGLALCVEVAFSAFLPLSFSFLIDRALVPRNRHVLVLVLGLLAGGVVVAAIVGVARDRLYSRLCAEVVADMRVRLFDHLQRLSLGFYSDTPAGEVFQRFSSDLLSVETSLTTVLSWAIAPALDICVYTVLLFVLDWRLALGSLLVWPVSLLGPSRLASRVVRSEYEKKQLEAAALAAVHENVSGQPVVKAFGLERARLAGFERRSAALRRETAHGAFLAALVERSAISGVLVLDVAVVGAGAWLTFDGSLSIGKLVAFQGLFLALGYAISNTMQYLPSLVQGLAGFRHIGELFEQRPQVVDGPAAVVLPRLQGEIVFERVTFGYTPAEPKLHDFSARIRQGEWVALVGGSGSGKSTVLSLLLRFYDPQGGSVTVDGQDLRTVSQASLRAQIGLVFQESFLFNETIRQNIRLSDPAVTDAQVESAARAAEIDKVIAAQPDGYDTLAGERGGRFSGGQRQRIAIARAIARDPAILILDEVTAALDPGTEAAINQTLARLGRGRTVVSVTHRLASAVDADRIFVLEHGRLVQQGTHQTLLAQSGPYRALWEKQSGFEISLDGRQATVEAYRLRRIDLFAGLGDQALDEIALELRSERYEADQTPFEQGDAGDRFYLIARGEVEVVATDPEGEEHLLGVLEDGDHFGEIALLQDRPRTATVRTRTPCLFLTLSRDELLALVARTPEMAPILQQRLAQREAGLKEWRRLTGQLAH